MITDHEIQLATPHDANRIAIMSRDLIEYGLGWRWSPSRVMRHIKAINVNVAVARQANKITGFGIMEYGDSEANLLLLAVDTPYRRLGVGAALIAWLETTALTAGIGVIRLETRSRNAEAREFYRQLGYHEVRMLPGFYRGIEDGVQFAKDLWARE